MTVFSTESGLSSEKKDLIDDKVTIEVVSSEKKGLTDDVSLISFVCHCICMYLYTFL